MCSAWPTGMPRPAGGPPSSRSRRSQRSGCSFRLTTETSQTRTGLSGCGCSRRSRDSRPTETGGAPRAADRRCRDERASNQRTGPLLELIQQAPGHAQTAGRRHDVEALHLAGGGVEPLETTAADRLPVRQDHHESAVVTDEVLGIGARPDAGMPPRIAVGDVGDILHEQRSRNGAVGRFLPDDE
jgi:hypothetical protein